MARIRSLKIGFFHNEQLCALTPWHRLLFAGLWVIADREGRLEDRPRRIKAELFPYDEIDVNRLLDELAGEGFVVRYAVEGVAYLAIPGFAKHQRPNSREVASLIPSPIYNQSTTLHAQGQEELSLGNGLGNGLREGEYTSVDVCGAAIESPEIAKTRADDFVEAWNTHTKPPIARCREVTTKRKKQIRSRHTERPIIEWIAVFQRIQASAFCRGESKSEWRASFDWVIGSPDVAVKVLEGKYDGRSEKSATVAEIPEPDNAWTAIRDKLRPRVNREYFQRWFASTRMVSNGGNRLVVSVPTQAAQAWIAKWYAELIAEVAGEIKPGVTVEFVVKGGA